MSWLVACDGGIMRSVYQGFSSSTDGIEDWFLVVAHGLFSEVPANVLGRTACCTPEPVDGLQADSSSRLSNSPSFSSGSTPLVFAGPAKLSPRKSFATPSYASCTTENAALAFEDNFPQTDFIPTVLEKKSAGFG